LHSVDIGGAGRFRIDNLTELNGVENPSGRFIRHHGVLGSWFEVV
jgi:hypothetical protein